MVILLCNAIAMIWRNHFLNYLSIFLKIEAFISLLFNFVLSGAFPLQWLKYFYLFKYFNKDWKSFSTSYSVMQLHPFGATLCPTSPRGISIQREMWKKELGCNCEGILSIFEKSVFKFLGIIQWELSIIDAKICYK